MVDNRPPVAQDFFKEFDKIAYEKIITRSLRNE